MTDLYIHAIIKIIHIDKIFYFIGGDIIKDIYYINDLEQLKALSDPLRINILTALGTTKQNSQQLANRLKINRTRIHYHLNILEEMGFIEVVDTDLVNGIVQKYYLPTAQAFVPAPDIFNELFCHEPIDFSIIKSQEQEFLKEFKMLLKKYAAEQDDKNGIKFSLLKI